MSHYEHHKLAIVIYSVSARRDKMRIAQRFYLWEIWHNTVSQSRKATPVGDD